MVQQRAYYGSPIAGFLDSSTEEILGCLAASSTGSIEGDQRDAWIAQVEILRSALRGVTGHVLLEFDVPRLGSRVDVVVISGAAVVPIEFKVGATEYRAADRDQAWDYGLDLKNFHEASHNASIFPVLCATQAVHSETSWSDPEPDAVRSPRQVNADGLRAAVIDAVREAEGDVIDGPSWASSPYHPTPTIIQAAQALYARHSVVAISRNDAGARNLSQTSRRVEQVIEQARLSGQKAIVFVTGVPGAGKTLVGLNVATQRRDETSATHAVFLSGNGPLVAVLREALVRDEVQREKARGERVRKGDVEQRVKPFIQIVHHFRDDGVRDLVRPPHDHVVIFDEAQRAWNQQATSSFMLRKKKVAGFNQSEPQFLIGYLDRHQDWAVVVCLVGGGQEINHGEAGIEEWLNAVENHFPHWHVFVSPELADREYAAEGTVRRLAQNGRAKLDTALHLAVSMRSFRAERVSGFVKAALDCDMAGARELMKDVARRYPVRLTRDLGAAKRWVRRQARGTERFGLVASSSAHRLKPHAVDIRAQVDPVHYFLGDSSDTRSSWYLEDAATEFQVQGLELDWTCVTWDADLRYENGEWSLFSFRGNRWERVLQADRRRYLVNAYRVLLTRARQGMVIFVPPGDANDHTRLPIYYNGTFDYLLSLGIRVLD